MIPITVFAPQAPLQGKPFTDRYLALVKRVSEKLSTVTAPLKLPLQGKQFTAI